MTNTSKHDKNNMLYKQMQKALNKCQKQTIVKHTQKYNKHSKQITININKCQTTIFRTNKCKKQKTCQNNLQTIVKHVQQITIIPNT